MNRPAFVLLALAAFSTTAVAADFTVGDRVHIAQAGKDGTVLAVGDKMMDGGANIKVHVDGAAYPADVGIMYDTAMARITVIGHGAGNAARAAAPRARPPQMGTVVANNRPPGHVPPSVANCQQAIRANYVATGDDQTIQVTFLAFENKGSSAYESVYKNDKILGAHGHVMRAMSIHAKYQVLTHFADPLADDQLRTYDGNFKCYDTATTGELVAEMTDRLGGGEHATYIKKR
jgi:hypothetical protein